MPHWLGLFTANLPVKAANRFFDIASLCDLVIKIAESFMESRIFWSDFRRKMFMNKKKRAMNSRQYEIIAKNSRAEFDAATEFSKLADYLERLALMPPADIKESLLYCIGFIRGNLHRL